MRPLSRYSFRLILHKLGSSVKKPHRCRVHVPQIAHFQPLRLFAFFHQADVRLYDFLQDDGAEEDGNKDTHNGQDDDQHQKQSATHTSDFWGRAATALCTVGAIHTACAVGGTPHPSRVPMLPPGGSADCVVKAEPAIIHKLIQEAYVPGPTEFVSGVIKTNDIPGLIEFSRVFDLNDFQA